MELTVKPITKTDKFTISELWAGNRHYCYVCEDTDRGLSSDMSLQNIKAIKVYGQTAIPAGRYEVILSHSNRFKRELPEILDVPGFTGIRIHAGNTAADSAGCLLLGTHIIPNGVGNSRSAVSRFINDMRVWLKSGPVYITINRDEQTQVS